MSAKTAEKNCTLHPIGIQSFDVIGMKIKWNIWFVSQHYAVKRFTKQIVLMNSNWSVHDDDFTDKDHFMLLIRQKYTVCVHVCNVVRSCQNNVLHAKCQWACAPLRSAHSHTRFGHVKRQFKLVALLKLFGTVDFMMSSLFALFECT